MIGLDSVHFKILPWNNEIFDFDLIRSVAYVMHNELLSQNNEISSWNNGIAQNVVKETQKQVRNQISKSRTKGWTVADTLRSSTDASREWTVRLNKRRDCECVDWLHLQVISNRVILNAGDNRPCCLYAWVRGSCSLWVDACQPWCLSASVTGEVTIKLNVHKIL